MKTKTVKAKAKKAPKKTVTTATVRKPNRVELHFENDENQIIEKAAEHKGLTRKVYLERMAISISSQIVSKIKPKKK